MVNRLLNNLPVRFAEASLTSLINQSPKPLRVSRRWVLIASRVLFIAALLSTVFIEAPGSDLRARVEGTVADQSEAKIAGARVVLLDSAGLVAHQARTDGEGRFSFTGVAEGKYLVVVEAIGFAQNSKTIVEIKAGASEPINLDLRLDIAAISDHIIVTASRTETALSESGGSVTVIAAEQLERKNQPLVSESLRLVPGIVVAQTGGRGGITSLFSRGGESDYNKVLIDGVPVNAAGGAFDFSSLTPENLDRIEVARGPRSALFGSDAMTSVIQLFTRRGASQTPELELSGEGGSFDSHRETARLSGKLNWFDYSASFGFQSTDGRFENSDFINRSASANFGFRLSDRANLRTTLRSNNNTVGVPGPTAILFADPDHRQKHRDLAASASLELVTTPKWHQAARVIYSEFDTNSFDPAAQDLTRADRPPIPIGSFGVDFAFSFRDHQKRAGFQYQTVAAVSGSSVITGGVDYEHESAVFTDDFSRVSPSRNNLGVYVQDQSQWRERLFITAGVRIEHNTGSIPEDLRAALAQLGSSAPSGDAGFGIAANPKIAVGFYARRHRDDARFGATRLKASFGTGIKESRLEEAFSPSIFFLGNPALEPERAVSFDAGASQEMFNRRASIEVTYYDNHFRDLIIFTFDPVTFGPVMLEDGRLANFINLERATARGIELIAAARPHRWLRLGASYTLLRSRIERAASGFFSEAGLPLLRRPRHSGTLEVSWAAPRFDITLDGSFVGRRRDVEPVTGGRFDVSGRPLFNDGYAKLNAYGSYRFSSFVTAYARVENLLNQDYEEILGFPAYRLNFSAGLRLRLGGGK